MSAAVTTTDLSALAGEINKVSGTTGITAQAAAGSLTLTQADGKDIRIEDFDHSTAATTIDFDPADANGDAVAGGPQLTAGAATDSAIATGIVTFDGEDSFSVASSVANTAGSILNVGAATSVVSAQSLVSAIDISSQSGSQEALKVIDAALATVNSIRGDLGAIQNRFTSTISNLSTNAENLSAARSRIQDADFAAETAALTRNQILQQAGVSILAQANAQPQLVLALLQ